MNNNYPDGPVANLTLLSHGKMKVINGVVIPTTHDLSGLRFDNVIDANGTRSDIYRAIANVLEKKDGHFVYDILRYNPHFDFGYDAYAWYAIANMTMNPMSRLVPGEKDIIGRFITTVCLENEFVMDFDGDFVQILNEGLVQQMLETSEVKCDEV